MKEAINLLKPGKAYNLTNRYISYLGLEYAGTERKRSTEYIFKDREGHKLTFTKTHLKRYQVIILDQDRKEV